MAGLFDDIINSPATATAPPAGGGLFDDIVGATPPAGTKEASQADLSWGDVPATAAANLLPSAGRFAGDIGQTLLHPIQTLEGLKNVALGVGEKAYNAVTGTAEPGAHEEAANAVGRMIASRYGSIDALKHTLATDPVGAAADIASVLGGGELAAARVPSLAKVAEVAGNVGRAIDPINNAVRATAAVGKGAGKAGASLLGVTTGVGTKPIEEAARAGFEGGQAGEAFRANMRGDVPIEDVVDEAKRGLQAIKDERQKAYNADMANLAQDTTVLDFNKVESAWNNARNTGSYKGISLKPSTAAAVREIDDVMAQWKGLPPADFHTPIGFDALKQRLNDVVEGATPGSAAQKVATQAYNIVKSQITAQAPEYAKTMAAYSKASDLVREMEKTLSLNRSASVDTQLRKLQSVMRDGVSTNYGARAKLAQVLVDNGASNLLSKLAGQSMAAVAPRGIARAVAAGLADLPAAAAIYMNPTLWPMALGSLVMHSPRAVGEAVHGAARAAGFASRAAQPIAPVLPAVPKALRAAYQAGRTQNQ